MAKSEDRRPDTFPWPALGGAERPSEYTAANLELFQRVHQYRYVPGALPHYRGVTYDGERHILPLFDVSMIDVEALVPLLDDVDCLYPLPAVIAARLDSRIFDFSANPDDSDYIYLAENLRLMTGRALHAKRTLLAKFEADHAPRVDHLQGREADARAVLAGWLADVGKAPSATDFSAAEQAIEQHISLGLDGLIAYDRRGEPLGFVLATIPTPDCGIVHFAKGRRSASGVYPFLFRALAQEWPTVEYLNFEQDLGNPGFRQNKRSYAPRRMLKKMRVRLASRAARLR